MLAALVRRNDESFMDLMQRLDTAVAKAVQTGEFTDEINARPPSRRSWPDAYIELAQEQ